MKLWMKILIGMVLGGLTGTIIGEKAVYLRSLGTLFFNLINMVMPLLILSSAATGITGIHQTKKLGEAGEKTIGIYLIPIVFSILLTIFISHFPLVGEGLALDYQPKAPTISEMIVSIIPKNPIDALANGHFLQIFIFGIFLGIGINLSGEKGKPLLLVLETLSNVMCCLTLFIMNFSLIGMFGMMAWMAGAFELDLF